MTSSEHVGCLTEHYGSVLKQLRELKKISQEELAFRTGLDRTYVSMLERNRRQPSLATVEKISAALAMKSSRFLKWLRMSASARRKKRTNRQNTCKK